MGAAGRSRHCADRSVARRQRGSCRIIVRLSRRAAVGGLYRDRRQNHRPDEELGRGHDRDVHRFFVHPPLRHFQRRPRRAGPETAADRSRRRCFFKCASVLAGPVRPETGSGKNVQRSPEPPACLRRIVRFGVPWGNPLRQAMDRNPMRNSRQHRSDDVLGPEKNNLTAGIKERRPAPAVGLCFPRVLFFSQKHKKTL